MVTRMNFSNSLEQELVRCHDLISSHPNNPRAFVQRGMVYFKLAEIDASIADFDKAEKIDPRLTPYLWQRGLSYYYAAKFAEGAKQFEVDLTVNFQDVEESVWRYLCIVQLRGATEARQSLLEVKNDPRFVMRRISDLYAGRCSTDDVLKFGTDESKHTKFYSHLYVGLYFEANNQVDLAKQHIIQAVGERIDDYMWHLAFVHQKLRGF
jgi:tetratricopeptide (TPR) repeat protein